MLIIREDTCDTRRLFIATYRADLHVSFTDSNVFSCFLYAKIRVIRGDYLSPHIARIHTYLYQVLTFSVLIIRADTRDTRKLRSESDRYHEVAPHRLPHIFPWFPLRHSHHPAQRLLITVRGKRHFHLGIGHPPVLFHHELNQHRT